MSELIFITAKLTGYRKRAKPVPSFATAYQFEPEPSLSASLGSLVAVIEVLANPKQAETVADLIIQILGDNYYNQSPGQAASLSAYQRFEQAVKAVNHELTAYADRGNAGWVGRLSAVLAVQCGSEFHITQSGSANGYLYRHGQTINITAEMSVLGPHRPQASFSSIASGQLEAEDRLLIATPALFHQIDRSALSEIISQNSPESAVSKLSEQINQSPHADRVAALVIEVTTPELLASRRGATGSSGEVKVGQPDNFIATAREAATPIFSSGLKTAKKAGEAALHHSKHTLVPRLRSAALTAVKALRKAVHHPKQRRWVALALVIVGALVAWTLYSSFNSQAINRLVSRYDNDFNLIDSAKQQIASGSKTEARQSLVTASSDLEQLSKLPQASLIDSSLKRRSRPESDPASIAKLKSQASALIDQIDGLITVSPQDVLSYDKLNGLKPSGLEFVSGKVILVDAAAGSVATVDPVTGLSGSPSTNASMGKIIDSVVSSANDGIYLLTAEPAVWFYKLDGSLTRQATSFGSWPKSRSIASYAGNLYLLADDASQIHKHTRSLAGFSGRVNYLASDAVSSISSSAALAVDGLVYVSGSFGLKRFNAGKLDQTVALPDTLNHSTGLASVADGNMILITDPTSGRLGLVSSSATGLTFLKQITLSGQTKITDSASDPAGKTIYALTASKLVRFPLPK